MTMRSHDNSPTAIEGPCAVWLGGVHKSVDGSVDGCVDFDVHTWDGRAPARTGFSH